MPIIDPDSPAASETSLSYWESELKNARILLYKYDEAIAALADAGVKSYTLDTGQSSQSVTRQDMAMLTERRRELMAQVRQLEQYLGVGKPGALNVFPGW
jgi:hypothetical protein